MKRKAFTLVEILVLFAILALIAAIAIPTIKKIAEKIQSSKIAAGQVEEYPKATMINISKIIEKVVFLPSDCKKIISFHQERSDGGKHLELFYESTYGTKKLAIYDVTLTGNTMSKTIDEIYSLDEPVEQE